MAWIEEEEQTVAGWSAVRRQIAAVMRLADPRIAFAGAELDGASESATACQLIPLSTSGRYMAPSNAYRLPKSTNGIEPEVSYLVTSACWAEVGDCRGFWLRSVVSTDTKSTYWLVKVALRNVNVGVLG